MCHPAEGDPLGPMRRLPLLTSTPSNIVFATTGTLVITATVKTMVLDPDQRIFPTYKYAPLGFSRVYLPAGKSLVLPEAHCC